MKNKPTKSQLVNAVTHYQTALAALVEGPFLSAEDLLEEVKAVVRNAPSLEPQAKSLVAEVEENPVAAQLTAEVEEPVDASEEPASA